MVATTTLLQTAALVLSILPPSLSAADSQCVQPYYDSKIPHKVKAQWWCRMYASLPADLMRNQPKFVVDGSRIENSPSDFVARQAECHERFDKFLSVTGFHELDAMARIFSLRSKAINCDPASIFNAVSDATDGKITNETILAKDSTFNNWDIRRLLVCEG